MLCENFENKNCFSGTQKGVAHKFWCLEWQLKIKKQKLAFLGVHLKSWNCKNNLVTDQQCFVNDANKKSWLDINWFEKPHWHNCVSTTKACEIPFYLILAEWSTTASSAVHNNSFIPN